MWNLVNCLPLVLNLLPGSLFVFDSFPLRPSDNEQFLGLLILGINFSNLIFDCQPQERQMLSYAECPPGLTYFQRRLP